MGVFLWIVFRLRRRMEDMLALGWVSQTVFWLILDRLNRDQDKNCLKYSDSCLAFLPATFYVNKGRDGIGRVKLISQIDKVKV